MKKTFSFLGIIILVMVIGFTAITCSEPGGNGGGNTGENNDGESLTEGEWTDGSITNPQGSIKYTFKVTAGNVYRIWKNDRYSGDKTKTLVTSHSVSYENGAAGSTQSASSIIAVTSSGTIAITVKPSASGIFNTGTFAVTYTVGHDSVSPDFPPFNPPSVELV